MVFEHELTMRMLAAVNEVSSPASEVIGVSSGEDMSIFPTLKSLGDLDLITGVLGEPEDGNGLVKMADADELYLALQIASTELGVQNDGLGMILKVSHEHQHATAIRHIGLRAIHAVRFARLTHGAGMKVTTIPVGEPVTKLAFASMIAYPRRLSRSDVRKLNIIGYASAADVADRINQNNDRSLLPLSVR